MAIKEALYSAQGKMDVLLDSSKESIEAAIAKLEQEIITKAHELFPSDTAEIQSLKTAQQFHANLISEYELIVGIIIKKEYDKLFARIPMIVSAEFKALGIPLSFTTADREIFTAIQKSVKDGFEYLGKDAVAKLASAVYTSVITGGSFGALVSNIESSMGILKKYASLRAHDSLMGYYQTLNIFKAEDAGIESFLYYGNIIKTSRQWCIPKVGRIFTIEEISAYDGQRWSGKKPGSTLINRGGYNCRHSWVPVPDGSEEEIAEMQIYHDSDD